MSARRAAAVFTVLAGALSLWLWRPAAEPRIQLQLVEVVQLASGRRIAVLSEGRGGQRRLPLPLSSAHGDQLEAILGGTPISIPALAALHAQGARLIEARFEDPSPDGAATLVVSGMLGRVRISVPAADALVAAAAEGVPLFALPSVLEASGFSADELRQVRAHRSSSGRAAVHSI